jgi:hypothetical protein
MYREKDNSTIGYMTDEGGAEPHGDTPRVDELLARGSVGTDRGTRFNFYAGGYSNGYWGTEQVDSMS